MGDTMILQCDGCGETVRECAKIPCAYIIESHNKKTRLIIPNDETAYRNFCFKCLIEQSEELT
jgi:hypothetical protein